MGTRHKSAFKLRATKFYGKQAEERIKENSDKFYRTEGSREFIATLVQAMIRGELSHAQNLVADFYKLLHPAELDESTHIGQLAIPQMARESLERAGYLNVGSIVHASDEQLLADCRERGSFGPGFLKVIRKAVSSVAAKLDRPPPGLFAKVDDAVLAEVHAMSRLGDEDDDELGDCDY